MHDVLPDEYKMNSNFFPIYYFYYNTVINDLAFRRKTLLALARLPLGVTENTIDGVVFTKVTTSARKYDSYEPPDPGTHIVHTHIVFISDNFYFSPAVEMRKSY